MSQGFSQEGERLETYKKEKDTNNGCCALRDRQGLSIAHKECLTHYLESNGRQITLPPFFFADFLPESPQFYTLSL